MSTATTNAVETEAMRAQRATEYEAMERTRRRMNAPAVYRCIAEVSAAIAKTGISKNRQNEQQHYKFRGIDDVYNALAPMLASNGLVILPRILTRAVVERTTAKGGVLFNVTVEAEFDFVAAEDGSKHIVRTFGEAMDSADKATNKAMSAAYKYAAFQAFCIPTEGDNDADATTHELRARPPAGYDEFLIDYESTADNGLDALRTAYKAARPDHREWLTNQDRERMDAAAARARAADERTANYSKAENIPLYPSDK